MPISVAAAAWIGSVLLLRVKRATPTWRSCYLSATYRLVGRRRRGAPPLRSRAPGSSGDGGHRIIRGRPLSPRRVVLFIIVLFKLPLLLPLGLLFGQLLVGNTFPALTMSKPVPAVENSKEKKGRTHFLSRVSGTSFVSFGTSLGLRSCCVRDGLETYGRS